MGKKVLVVLVLLSTVIVSGISMAQEADETVLTAEQTVQTTEVFQFADGAAVEDSFARLSRFDNGLTAVISTSDLVVGDVYTLWWVIFNNPQLCSDDACSEDDIFVLDGGAPILDEVGNFVLNMEQIENVGISIQHAAGGYAVDDTFNTSASLGLGDVPGIVVGPGLENPFSAEVHLVVRTHGEAVANAYADQISTFGGGCDPIMAAPCQDVQFSVFAPAVQ